jgi:hypothetical protein
VGAVLVAGALLLLYRRIWPPRQGLNPAQTTYRGTPAKVRRLRETLQAVQSESVEDLIKGLYHEENYAQWVDFAGDARPPQVDLQQCLSNPRVLRLQQGPLPGMGETERARFVEEFAERAFQTQRDREEQSFRRTLDPKAPDVTDSFVANKLAICASWWLAAHFASAADLVRHMEKLEAYAAQLHARVANEPRLSDEMKGWWRYTIYGMQPDNACKVTILAVAIERDRGVSAAARAEARRLLSPLPSRKLTVLGSEYTIYRFKEDDEFQAQAMGKEAEVIPALRRLAAGR